MEIYLFGEPPAGLSAIRRQHGAEPLLSSPSAHIIWASTNEFVVRTENEVQVFTERDQIILAKNHPLVEAAPDKVTCFGDDEIGLFGFNVAGCTYLVKGDVSAANEESSIERPFRTNLKASHIAVSGDARTVVILSRLAPDDSIRILQYDCFSEDTFPLFRPKFELEPFRSHRQFNQARSSFVQHLSSLDGTTDQMVAPQTLEIPSSGAEVRQLVADDDSFSLLLDSGDVYTWTHERRQFGLARDVQDPDTFLTDDALAASAAAPGLTDVKSQSMGQCVHLTAAGPVTIAVTRREIPPAQGGSAPTTPPQTIGQAYLWGPILQSAPGPFGVPPWLMSEMGYEVWTRAFDDLNLHARRSLDLRGEDLMSSAIQESLVAMASVAPRHCAVIDHEGKVWTVGDNTFGQLGRSTEHHAHDRFWETMELPVSKNDTKRVVQIACTGRATYLIVA